MRDTIALARADALGRESRARLLSGGCCRSGAGIGRPQRGPASPSRRGHGASRKSDYGNSRSRRYHLRTTRKCRASSQTVVPGNAASHRAGRAGPSELRQPEVVSGTRSQPEACVRTRPIIDATALDMRCVALVLSGTDIATPQATCQGVVHDISTEYRGSQYRIRVAGGTSVSALF